MRSRRLVLILLAVVASAILLWFLRPRRTTVPAPPQRTAAPAARSPSPFAAGEPNTQRQLAQDLVTRGVTLDRARWYFSLEVGRLPGVTVPAAVARDMADFDGTSAVLYLYQVWDQLTADQQRAAEVLIHPAGTGQTGGQHPVAARRPGGGPDVRLARYVPVVNTDVPSHDYASLAKNAMNALAQALGKPAIPLVVSVAYDDVTDDSEFAHTTSFWSLFDSKYTVHVPFDPWHCEITVHDKKFIPLDDISTAAILTHESTHCFQDQVAVTYVNRASQPRWVADGTADWAMAEIVPQATQVLEQPWRDYILDPKKLYSDRWYDAIGVFGHFSDLAPQAIAWGRLLDVVKASQGNQNEAALNALIDGARTSYFSDWGASYFELARDRWRIASPNAPTISGPAPDAVNLVPDATTQISAGPYQATMATVTSDADLLVVSLLTGYGRAHDEGFGLDTALDTGAPLVLCLKQGGCTCPDGSNAAGVETQRATSPIAIGIDGGDTTAQVELMAKPLPTFCQQPNDNRPPPPPPGGGGGGGGGGGAPDNQPSPAPDGHLTGDPHLQTFDGARVEFQKVGEYTLVRSTRDDFVVQVRQVPAAFSRFVSANRAVATKIGGQRATVTEENGRIVLRLDGQAVTGDPPLLQGGTITRALTAFGTNFTFEWPDGTVLHADQLAGYTINLHVVPSPVRRGSLEGLLGNDDGNAENDETSASALADKWRVTQATSLFDYLPGQTTATFTDPTFPDAGDGVTDRAKAERDCREEGVTDPNLLHDCIIDFGITNGFLFRDQYAHQQAVLAARAALMPAATTHGAAETRSLLMAGTITDPKFTPQVTFTAQAGDVIYIAQGPDCVDRAPDWWNNKPNTVIYFMLYDPAGNQVGYGNPGCEMGRRSLADAGTYTMKANEAKNQIGAYHVPIHFVRHDRVKPIKYGDIVSGTVEQPGAHDFYTFSAKAGDIIQVAGQGCQLASGLYLGIIQPSQWPQWMSHPQGGAAPGPSCNQGSVAKISEDGMYALLVNSGDGGSGAYQFVFQGVPGGGQSQH
jgi:von Willebrand factor type D domain